jgi:nitroreductase
MINKAILNRRSIRNFSDREVLDKDLKEIIKSGQFAPTGMNNRSWEFIVVRDTELKEKLYELTSTMYRQDSIRNAPVVLIPVIDANKSTTPIQDLSTVSENIFIQVAELGLGSFWKNVLPGEVGGIREAFGIPENFTLINIIPIGHPVVEVTPHADDKFNESVIHFEKW